MDNKIEFKTRSLADFFKSNDEKRMLLPNFQRGFVWKEVDKQKSLLSSFIFDLPIGSILIGIGKSDLFSVRPLCFRKPVSPAESSSCEYLIDGQQRLSTLYSIFCDLWSSNYYKGQHGISSDSLRHRWFVKIYRDSCPTDLFGYKKLEFDESVFNQIDSTNDFDEWLECKQVRDEDKSNWWDPSYEIKNQPTSSDPILFRNNGARFTKRLEGYLDPENLLMPLFDIVTHDRDTLHDVCLQKIAESRMKQIVEDHDLCIELSLDPSDKESQEEHIKKWKSNIIDFFRRKLSVQIPYIQIPDQLFCNRGINIFQSLNIGGTKLTNYDLIVAKAALEDKKQSLTEKINSLLTKSISLSRYGKDFKPYSLKAIVEKYSKKSDTLISSDFLEQFLKILSIQCSEDGNISLDKLKQSGYLKLTSHQINNHYEDSINALLNSYAFLHFECGLRKSKLLPYRLMIIPIAYIFLKLKRDEFYSDPVQEKLKYWFWKALFSGQYRENQNPRCVEHARDLFSWIASGTKNPFLKWDETLFKVQDYFDEHSVRNNKIHASMKESFLMYLLSKKPSDMTSENQKTLSSIDEKDSFDKKGTKDKLTLEVHHIIPLKFYAKSISQDSDSLRRNSNHPINSVFNKTFLSKPSNQALSGDTWESYSQFLNNITLESHLISESWEKTKNKQIDQKKLEDLLVSRFHELEKDLKKMFQQLEGRDS